MTIHDRIKTIRTDADLSQEQFAASLGLKRSTIAAIEGGAQLPTLEIIAETVKKYDISYRWLIEGAGPKKVDIKTNKKQSTQQSTQMSTHTLQKKGDSYIKKGDKFIVSEPVQQYVVDTSGLRMVPVVDISAAAGDGYLNAELLDEHQVLRLPATMVKSGYHLCIRVKGPSMAPTFQDGGYLVIRLLDRSEWLNLRNEYIYVVVDKESKTYVKRIKNRFSGADGFIVCMSDNPDKTSHPNFNLHPDEILHIWFVEWYFTAKMPNIHDQYYSRVSNLEDKVDQIMEQFHNFKKQLK